MCIWGIGVFATKARSLLYPGMESLYTRQDGLSMWGLQSFVLRQQSFVLRQQSMKTRLRNGGFCQERAGKDCFSYMAGCSGESYEPSWTCWESSVRKKVRNLNKELPVGKFRVSLELVIRVSFNLYCCPHWHHFEENENAGTCFWTTWTFNLKNDAWLYAWG